MFFFFIPHARILSLAGTQPLTRRGSQEAVDGSVYLPAAQKAFPLHEDAGKGVRLAPSRQEADVLEQFVVEVLLQEKFLRKRIDFAFNTSCTLFDPFVRDKFDRRNNDDENKNLKRVMVRDGICGE